VLVVIAGVAGGAVVDAQAPPSVSVPMSLILPNYDRVPIGQREAIEAGAFAARTNDAGSNWFNPAGLARARESSINASATAWDLTRVSIEGFGESIGRSRIGTIPTLFATVLGTPPLESDRWRIGFSVAQPVGWLPSSIDLGGSGTTEGRQAILGYGTAVNFYTFIPAINVGFAPHGVGKSSFRVGAGAGVAVTSLSQDLSVSQRVITSTSSSSALRTFSAGGFTWNLVLTGGLQWDATSHVSFGVRAVAPGIRLLGSTRLTYQDIRFGTGGSADIAFRDPEARFEYKLPFEVDIGAAYRGSRGEVEVDVRYYGAIDEYAMYTSERQGQLTVSPSTGPPQVSMVPFVTTLNSARAATNVSVGGNYQLARILRVHAGVATDQSPVDDESASIFRQVDLIRGTTGVSLTGLSLSGTIGLAFSAGSGRRQALDLVNVETPSTRLEVQTLNVLFALSYAF